jgi:carboxylesterase
MAVDNPVAAGRTTVAAHRQPGATHVTVLPGAEPFSSDGGEVGVLLCHGFTGSPQSLRPWAEGLSDAGYTVRVPRLPGHGTSWQEMNTTTFDQWFECVDSAFRELAARSAAVVVGGLSMGGALALRLAETHGERVAGLVLVNPAVKSEDPRLVAVPVLKHLVPSIPGIGSDIKRTGMTELAYDRTPLRALHSMLRGWKAVVADLGRVTQPVLIFRSPEDHVVPASSTALIRQRVGSADVTEVLCDDSYHVATLDNDADLIVEGSLTFIDRVAVADRSTP